MSTLPYQSGLIETLHGIRRRFKAYAVALGAGLVLAVGAGLLLLTVLLDWTLNLPTVPRVILVLLALGAFAVAVYTWLLKPLMSRLSLGDVAGHIENEYPEFDDRLRSTINFIAGDDVPGSDPMKRRVVAQANELAGRVDMRRVIATRPVWYSLAGGAGAVVVLALLAALVGGDFLSIVGNRLLGGNAKYPKSVQISVIGDTPQRVPVGKPVEVKMRLTKGANKAKKAVILYRNDPTGPWQQELMTRQADGTFTANIDTKLKNDADRGTLQIRMKAGDDEVALAPVTVVPRLDISRIEARITPPPYAREGQQDFQAAIVNLGDRPGVAAMGSDVELQIVFNKPLAKDQDVSLQMVKTEQKSPDVKWDRLGNAGAVGRFGAGESVRFVVRATDEDGFQNTGTEEYELIVREDAMPSVQIEEPRRSEDRTPNAAFPLKVSAEDDYGVSRLQLVVNRLNASQKPAGGDNKEDTQDPNARHQWVVDLVNGGVAAQGASWTAGEGGAERKRFRLDYQWDLAKLENANLKPGDVLEYFVQVKDNFNLAGREHDWVPSGKLRITVVSQDQAERQDLALAEQLHDAIKQVQRNVISTKTETQQLAEQTEKNGKFDAGDEKQAERLANQQATAAQQTKQVAGKLQNLLERMQQNKTSEKSLQPAVEQANKQLEQTAENPLKDATQNLNQAKDNKAGPKANAEQQKQNAEQRNQQLAQAQEKQQQAADQLQQAAEKLGNFGGLSEAIQRLEDIQKKQKELTDKFNKEMQKHLGKKPEEMDQKAQDDLKKMADEQKQLSDQTNKAIDAMQKKSDQMQKSDPQAAEAMKQSAQTGQQQGVPQKQQQASQSMQQNKQSQAQNQQQQVQLGIEMMLQVLKEAERRKLEELAKKLAEIQTLVDELVRRQAGHNIDNLTLDDVKKWEAMTQEQRDELMALSMRDPAALPPPPVLQQLTASQEQTERNARDVAKQAETLPDPAPAAKLTQAAGQMERAIVHLRAAKLPDAYDPPQVEALAALIEAKAKVDEALKKIQDEIQQKDQETIRQGYVKLLEAQKKITARTKELETAKAAAGRKELPRELLIGPDGLGELPTRQGKLSEDATKLGTELEKIGSIVYVWANKDIVKTMDEVKTDLAKPETGEVVQAEQTRIEEQLDAMIKNLVEKPKPSEFVQKGGGGGGKGTPKVKMPSEAELRLLKGLQEAVNTSTKKIDAGQEKKDAQRLLALGGRQGEMRNLLDQLVRASSEGKLNLGEEPDNKDQLPEEADEEDIENQEFEQGLLDGELTDDTVENNVKLTGDRMARSRQRLALNNDPGKTTQKIQERIVKDLELMIELARRQIPKNPKMQQAQGQGQKQKGPQLGQGQQGQQKADGKGKQGQGKQLGQQTGGQSPAEQSALNQGGSHDADASKPLKEAMGEWGGLTPRQRDAVTEGQSEQVIDKYRRLVEDYYRELGKKSSGR